MKKDDDTSTLQRLVEAAKIEMAASGFANTTVEQITKRAQVAKGTFYLYFNTKEDVVRCMMEEMFEKISLVLEESIKKLDSSSLNFNTIIHETILKTLNEHYKLKDIIVTVLNTNKELSNELFSFRSSIFFRLRRAVETIISKSIEKKLIRPVRTDLISFMLFTIFVNFSTEILFKEGVERLDEYVSVIEDFILNGLLPKKEDQ